MGKKNIKSAKRLMINICSADLPRSKNFYTQLFDFKVDFDSDWFIHLVSEKNSFELGIINRTNEIVPTDYQNSPQGFFITLVVDDVDEIYKLAKLNKVEIVRSPTNTHYGQRQLLLKDPDGALIDVSSMIKN